MIDHITLRVADIEKSHAFYESCFQCMNWKYSFGDKGVFSAFDIGNGCLYEIAQNSGEVPPTPVHVAFRATSRKQVDQFYGAALAAGASDNGAPGPRPQYTENYYACFVFDPDGNNIEMMFDGVYQ